MVGEVGVVKVMEGERGEEMYIDRSWKKVGMGDREEWVMEEENVKREFGKRKVEWSWIGSKEELWKAVVLVLKERG